MSIIPKTSGLPKQLDTYPFIAPERYAGKLKGKVVVLTGASAGIGRTTALAFAAAGASVACVARRKNLLDEIVQEIKDKHNVPAVAIAVDIVDSSAPKQIIDTTESALGPIDILVNNAGLQRALRMEDDKNFADWWQLFELNLKAPSALIHALLPRMTSRKSGTIVNLSSLSGAHDVAWQSAYSTSKAAMIKLFQELSREVAESGVLFYSVHPGCIWTDMVEDNFKLSMEHYAEQLKDVKMEIQWQPKEMAANTLVAVCAEERCKVMNGRYIDGEQDLEKVLEVYESGRVQKERLYWLKVDEL